MPTQLTEAELCIKAGLVPGVRKWTALHYMGTGRGFWHTFGNMGASSPGTRWMDSTPFGDTGVAFVRRQVELPTHDGHAIHYIYFADCVELGGDGQLPNIDDTVEILRMLQDGPPRKDS